MQFRATLNTNVKLKVDNRQWNKMARRLSTGGNKTIQVGWWGNRHPSGPPVAQIAAWNEEGHINGGMFAGTVTPARPFIRTGFVPYSKNLIKTYYRDFHAIAMGTTTWSRLYNDMGTRFVELMQQTIHKWDSPANSPTTIALKGFNNPLVETGYMQSSVKYKIVLRGARA